MRAVVVMAAGLSRRMGEQDKLLFEIHGVPLYQRALNLAREVRPDLAVVVTNQSIIADAAQKLGFMTVSSPHAADGMGYSVAAGARMLSENANAVLFLPADQPFLKVQTIERLLKVCEQKNRIIVPRVMGKPASPCVFPGRFLEELGSLTGESGGRTIWMRHISDVLFIDFTDRPQFMDIDTPESYANALAQY